MREWRRGHRRATLTEIERALDAHRARSRVLTHVAEASPAPVLAWMMHGNRSSLSG